MNPDAETTALLLKCERDEKAHTLAFMALDQHKSRCWSIIAGCLPGEYRERKLADSLAQLKTDLTEIAYFFGAASTSTTHTKTEKE